MTKEEQVKPLTPAVHHFRSDHNEDEAMSKNVLKSHRRRRRCLQCFGCFTALLSVLVVIIIVILIVFPVKNPRIKMNSLTIQPLEFSNNGQLRTDKNITILADVSVGNPNAASLRYTNTTSTIYYYGVVVGEGRIPAGLAKARRTIRMNVTVDIDPSKILAVPSWTSDIFSSRVINMSSYTRIDGRVKLLKIIKKHVYVKMNCTITYNFTSQAIQDNCRQHAHV